LHQLRRHAGQRDVAANLRRLLERSRILPSHKDCGRVQDPYSLRCAPQVHGASRDSLRHIASVLEIEANAVTDNPIVFPGGDIISGGNFHAQPIALAADMLKIAVAELADISERRTELLVNPDLSGLPAFLAHDTGLNSGLMIAQVAAAALVSENKVLAHPASVDSIPTSAGKEDHVSMATAAARQARAIVENAEHVLAIELMCGFHALAFETKLRAGWGVEAARTVLRSVLRPLKSDRELAPDIEAITELLRDGRLLAGVTKRLGPLA
jgi:histidine ammonia-lyase